MSYNVDELFRFIKNTDKKLDGYALAEYLKKDDPTVTELEIPDEYNGLPVTLLCYDCFASSHFLKCVFVPQSVRVIARRAFHDCKALETVGLCEGLIEINSMAFEYCGVKSVKLPKSLKKLGSAAFFFCESLEHVEFAGMPIEFGSRVFRKCEKLPAETYVMGLVCSPDVKDPVKKADYRDILEWHTERNFFDRDVFALLAKNNCFREVNVKYLFEGVIEKNAVELLSIANDCGMLSSVKLLDMLIDYSTGCKKIECTAYLLELKKRKFGLNGGDKFEL